MAENLGGSVGRLRALAGSLRINGDTAEQSLLLAIIDALDGFAAAIDAKPGQADMLTSQCPNCGKMINLDVCNLRGDEPVVCGNCHEIIGVISDNI